MIPKNRGENFSSRFLDLEFFCVGVSRYAATPFIIVLSPGHNDITKFRPWSPIATGNHFHRAEKTPNLLIRLSPLTFLIRVHAFPGPTSQRTSACPNLHE